MAKMRGTEDEGAGSVLKSCPSQNPIATQQIGYYDTPPFLLQEKGLFQVYRLVKDAKPDRVMMWPSENLGACSGEFLKATASMTQKSHFASSTRG